MDYYRFGRVVLRWVHIGLALGLLLGLAVQPVSVRAQAEVLYLPIIMGGSETTPPPGGLVNGDFEAGQTGWTEFSVNDFPLIMSEDLPIPPHGGEWMAWLGGADNEEATLTQTFMVTEDTDFLSFWYLIGSLDTACEGDVIEIIFNGSVAGEDFLCQDTATDGWVPGVWNMTALVGTEVQLAFQIFTDEAEVSNFFLDDVMLSGEAPDLGGLTEPAWGSTVEVKPVR